MTNTRVLLERRTFIALASRLSLAVGLGSFGSACDRESSKPKPSQGDDPSGDEPASPSPAPSIVDSYEPEFDRVHSASIYENIVGKSIASDLTAERAKQATVPARQDFTEVDLVFDDAEQRESKMVLLGQRDGWLMGFCYRYLVDFHFPKAGRERLGSAEYSDPKLTVLDRQYPLRRHDGPGLPNSGEGSFAWYRTFGEHDAALVYIPTTSGSNSAQHLGIEDPEQVLQHTLQNHSSIFGLEFILLSKESVDFLGTGQPTDIDMVAFATGMAVVALALAPLLGSLAASTLSMATWASPGRKLLAQALPIALNLGQEFLLREDGFVSQQLGEEARVALLGVNFPTPGSDGYGLLEKFISGLATDQSEPLQFVAFGEHSGVQRGHVLIPGNHMCLSAELLSRGLVRLDTDDEDVLREFPELTTAALAAVESKHLLAAQWATEDAEYVTQLQTLHRVVAG